VKLPPFRILVVDDDSAAVRSISRALKHEGYEVTAAETAADSLEKFRQQECDLALVDLRLPDMDGVKVIREMVKAKPEMPVIVMTAYGDVETAVTCMQAGAKDFLLKPLDIHVLRLRVKNALDHLLARRALEHLIWEVQETYQLTKMVGASKAMAEVFDAIRRVAPTDSSVMILGESGTGKELVARAIHYNSPRRDRPFHALNCSALPEGIVESELFGHVRGAFTGAVAPRKGRLEAAAGGTLFIDEVGNLPIQVQTKLLRVLEEKKFEPVGSTESVEVDIRLITATNADLEQAIEESLFRQDLYYRLKVVTITLPPLRQRDDDIPLLVEHFLREMRKKLDKPGLQINPEAMMLLRKYHWPGNVRELRNVIESMCVLDRDGVLTLEDVPESIAKARDKAADVIEFVPGVPLAAIEREVILKTLEHCGGNRTHTAQVLGIGLRTLQRRLQQYGLNQ